MLQKTKNDDLTDKFTEVLRALHFRLSRHSTDHTVSSQLRDDRSVVSRIGKRMRRQNRRNILRSRGLDAINFMSQIQILKLKKKTLGGHCIYSHLCFIGSFVSLKFYS